MKLRPVVTQLLCLAALTQLSCPPLALAQGYENEYSQALTYLNQGDYGNAINYMNQALAESSEEGHVNDYVAAQLHHTLGQIYFKQGDYATAEPQFHEEERMLELSPTNPIDATSTAPSLAFCMVALGDTRYALQDYDDAARNYTKALDILRSLPGTYDVRAEVADAAQKLASCQKNFKNSD